jgi:hypothetical protein
MHVIRRRGSDLMNESGLADLKEKLRAQGFGNKALVTEQEMELATRQANALDGALDTPGDELRYIEGLFNLPLGFIEYFRLVPAKGHERCACGRVPSALDVVHTALRKSIHGKELMRDTLIGFSNIIEMSDDGRTAECFHCSRAVVVSVYWKQGYMYA